MIQISSKSNFLSDQFSPNLQNVDFFAVDSSIMLGGYLCGGETADMEKSHSSTKFHSYQ